MSDQSMPQKKRFKPIPGAPLKKPAIRPIPPAKIKPDLKYSLLRRRKEMNRLMKEL